MHNFDTSVVNVFVLYIVSVCFLSRLINIICDQACKNQPSEHNWHQAIFLLISSVLNVVSCVYKLQKEAH